MDSNDQERERGITIQQNASVEWKGVPSISSTRRAADFGGEVEPVLSMVDGVVVLVDAEGPMPQTKFVVGKALKLGLRPIVLVNKVDKPEARAHEVHDETFDLFAALDANEDQLDFPILFSSAKEGWAAPDPNGLQEDMSPLFDLIVDYVPPPSVEEDGDFRLLATMLDAEPYLGRVLTGRVESGVLKTNTTIKSLSRDGTELERTRITKLLAFRGLERVSVESVSAGDIVAIAGFAEATVADTLCDLEVGEPLAAEAIDPPTLAMTFSVNDSPLAGREGNKVTSRMIQTIDVGRRQCCFKDCRYP